MSPYDAWLKLIAAGLEAVAEEIHSIARAVNDMVTGQTPEKPVKSKKCRQKESRYSPKEGSKESQA